MDSLLKNVEYLKGKEDVFSLPTAVMLSCGYLAVLKVLKVFMKDRKAFDGPIFNAIQLIHNLILFAFSAIVAVGVTYEYMLSKGDSGLSALSAANLFCGHTDPLLNNRNLKFWANAFVASKIYEWVDTFLLVLKKKPTIFLHVYHHFITFILGVVVVNDELQLVLTFTWTNALVHVLMYYYYSIACLGKTVWWKRYLTQLQLVQFVFCLCAITYVSYVNGQHASNAKEGLAYLSDPKTWLSNDQRGYCPGSTRSIVISFLVYLSFLKLFIDLYKNIYSKGGAPKKKKAN